MQTDPLADFVSALYNATIVGKKEMSVPYSRLKRDVASVLKEEGYIEALEVDKTVKAKPVLKLSLRGNAKARVFQAIRRMSKPGLRRYVGVTEIPRVLGGLGISVLSTSQGVMSGHKAKKLNLGGELLLTVH